MPTLLAPRCDRGRGGLIILSAATICSAESRCPLLLPITMAERRAPHALRSRWSRGRAAPPGRASPVRGARLPVCAKAAWQSRQRLGAPRWPALGPCHVGGRDAGLAISGAAPPPQDAACSGQRPAQV